MVFPGGLVDIGMPGRLVGPIDRGGERLARDWEKCMV